MVKPIVREVLEHTRTYRMTLPAAVAKLFGIETDIALELLETLHAAGMLAKAPLTPWQDYYYLQEKAAQVSTVQPEHCMPLVGESKVVAYAVLSFCCMSDVYRPRITAVQFRSRLEPLFRDGPKTNYYTEGKRLGYIRVETSHNSKGDSSRVIERCRKDIHQRCAWKKGSSPQFQALVAAGNFTVTYLTAFQSKADRINQERNRIQERYNQYWSVKQVKLRQEETGGGGFVERDMYKRVYLKYERQGRTPPPPPPMQAHAIAGLFDLIYPKPAGIKPN